MDLVLRVSALIEFYDFYVQCNTLPAFVDSHKNDLLIFNHFEIQNGLQCEWSNSV